MNKDTQTALILSRGGLDTETSIYDKIITMKLYVSEVEYQNGELVPKTLYYSSPFSDFRFSMQADWASDAFRSYAFYAEYSKVTVKDYKAKMAFLKKIERVQQNFPVQPTTFGQWVQLTAQGLKLNHFLIRNEAQTQSRTGREYSSRSITEIQDKIDWMIEEVRHKYAPEKAMALCNY